MLCKLVSELKERTLIVEGRRDFEALKELGLSDVIMMNGRPVFRLIENLQGKEVVILTDFDREGRRLASRLQKMLEKNRIAVNRRLRKEVASLGVKRIEDLKGLFALKTKRGDRYGKTCSYFDKICNSCKHQGRWSCGKAGCYWGGFWSDRGFAWV